MFDQETPLPPCNFVIFGATGNLASNKLLPALYRLELAGKLAEGLNFVAFGRREWDDVLWRDYVRTLLTNKLKVDVADLERFVNRFDYLRGELNDPQAFLDLKEVLAVQNRVGIVRRSQLGAL